MDCSRHRLAMIYATLGQTPAIVAALGTDIIESVEANLVFALLILLVVIPVFFIDKRLARVEIAVGIGILAVFLLTWLRLGSWEERTTCSSTRWWRRSCTKRFWSANPTAVVCPRQPCWR